MPNLATCARTVVRLLTFLLRDIAGRFARIRQAARPAVRRPRTRRARRARVVVPAVQLALF